MVKGLNDFKMPKWKDLPVIPLYLDQVLLLIDEWLGDYLAEDGKRVMTKMMVNNYVKLKFIDAPVNRKYKRIAVAKLFVIAILKPVFTMEEIKALIELAVDFGDTPEESYDQFCRLVDDAVDHAFHNTTFAKCKNPDDPRNICWNVCNAFASQLYVRHIYLEHIENNKNGDGEKVL